MKAEFDWRSSLMFYKFLYGKNFLQSKKLSFIVDLFETTDEYTPLDFFPERLLQNGVWSFKGTERLLN